jgi:hypothetical protein
MLKIATMTTTINALFEVSCRLVGQHTNRKRLLEIVIIRNAEIIVE